MRTILALFIAFISVEFSKACTICGCSASGFYTGVLPFQRDHLVGIRHQYRYFSSNHPVITTESPETSKDQFHTTEIWGRAQLSKRWNVMAFVPINFYSQASSTGEVHNTSGLGDAMALLNWLPYFSQDTSISQTSHMLRVGAGVKAPTGRFNIRNPESGLLMQNMQPGSGSVDVIANAAYTYRQRNWGSNTELSYRYNTPNRNDYQFGQRIGLSTSVFLWKGIVPIKGAILPQIGLHGEWSAKDHSNYSYDLLNDYSGGSVLQLSGGADLYVGNAGFGLMAFVPVAQQLADGYIKNKFRLTFQFFYTIKSKSKK